MSAIDLVCAFRGQTRESQQDGRILAVGDPIANAFFESSLMSDLQTIDTSALSNGFDIVLRAGDTHFYCHRAILSARSFYFRSLFSSQIGVGQSSFIEPLKDTPFPPALLLPILTFIISGKCDLDCSSAIDLFEMADFFQLPDLCSAIELFLIDNLDSLELSSLQEWLDSLSSPLEDLNKAIRDSLSSSSTHIEEN